MKFRRRFRVLTFTLVASALSVGFYSIPQRWRINRDDPTIWINFCDVSTFTTFAYPDGDPLGGSRGHSFDEVVQSVLDDVNSIPTSYLRLARYPGDPNNPGDPVEGDSAFSTSKAGHRTVSVCFGDTSFNVAGFAENSFSGNNLVGCSITISPDYKKHAAAFIAVFTHELGHCLGLMHPQDTVHSLMSYFHDDSKGIRFESDDKMGITYLYPQESSYGKERASYGAACKQR